jgi:MATE family, multidrug efflux pump
MAPLLRERRRRFVTMNPIVAELRALTRLASPIAAAHIGFILLGIVDTAVVGRLGETPLGAIGIANSLFYAFVMFGGGLVMGTEPLIAQALGADEGSLAERGLWQGIWLAILIALPLSMLAAASTAILVPIGVEAEAARQASHYLLARLLALPVLLVFTAARTFLQAKGITRPMIVGVAIANLLNVPLNVLLVFGDEALIKLGVAPLGVPALGIVGAGITSSAVTIVQLLVVLLALRGVGGASRWRRPERPLLAKSARLGLPIGLQRLAEMGIFSITGLLMARLGTRAVASHHVVMTLVTATFMVPLGISAAASIRVGRAIGAGDQAWARRSGFVALVMGFGFMSLCAITLLLFPRPLLGLMTDRAPVLDAAETLLVIAALFQVSDGIQVVANGALRGLGDTRIVLYANLAGHYVLGVPLGVVLAFVVGWGATGLWWGLFAGLMAVALALVVRFARLSSQVVQRV